MRVTWTPEPQEVAVIEDGIITQGGDTDLAGLLRAAEGLEVPVPNGQPRPMRLDWGGIMGLQAMGWPITLEPTTPAETEAWRQLTQGTIVL